MNDSPGRAMPQGPLWAVLIATFFGVGRLRPGPGTWASAAAMLIWAAIAHALQPSLRTPLAIVAVVLTMLLGIPAATWVSRASANKDPQFVVIDEVAGQLIS